MRIKKLASRLFEKTEKTNEKGSEHLAQLLDEVLEGSDELVAADGIARGNLTESLTRICALTR